MKNKETYLSDWLENKITNEQLKQIISNEDFIAYQKIKSSLDNYQIENEDLEKSFQSIKSKIEQKKSQQKTPVISLWKYVSIAASIVVLFGTYFYFSYQNNFETGFGEKENIVLLDHSKVILNAKSQLTYSNSFIFNRSLKLNGEAFFEVEKGSKFTVETKQGTVSVLGTKFNVNVSDNFFEVICYQGKVSVSFNKKKTILTQGESIRNYNSNVENWVDYNIKKPTWIANETTFKNTPIFIVFQKIKNQYGTNISFPNAVANTVFTGTISHKNINDALQSVCIPLHLKFKQVSSNKIEIMNE